MELDTSETEKEKCIFYTEKTAAY